MGSVTAVIARSATGDLLFWAGALIAAIGVALFLSGLMGR